MRTPKRPALGMAIAIGLSALAWATGITLVAQAFQPKQEILTCK
jgi:hypothetical protein